MLKYISLFFGAIDPMHNLVWGTAKHMFKLWVERDILSKLKLEKVERKLTPQHILVEFLLPHFWKIMGYFLQLSEKIGQSHFHCMLCVVFYQM